MLSSSQLLEQYRPALIAALSILILVGSGISLGVGISELNRQEQAPVSSTNLRALEPSTVSAKPAVKFPLNINLATAAELEALPEIGAVKAQAIVDYRQQYGPFKTIEEIDNVSGIGPATYEAIKGLITVQ